VPGGRRPRIYVHIGEPKTGTTFLQRALWGNRARLAAQGILLPGYEGRDHNRASRDLREAPREAADPTDPWTDVQAAAADRRQWRFWTFHDTLAILDMWSRHLPPDQVHVITVPRQGPASTLWVRFASVLGIDPSRVDLAEAHANPSLGLAEVEFLRRLNETLPEEMPYWFYTRNVKRILAHDVLAVRARQARLTVPASREAWVKDQSEILVAGLRDSKFHIVGDLGELLPQPVAGPYRGPADLPAEQVLDAAVAATAALTDQRYRDRYPAPQARTKRGGPRQMVVRLEWTVLNGPRVRRVLRKRSRLPAVRRLRVLIWRVLLHPTRHRG